MYQCMASSFCRVMSTDIELKVTADGNSGWKVTCGSETLKRSVNRSVIDEWMRTYGHLHQIRMYFFSKMPPTITHEQRIKQKLKELRDADNGTNVAPCVDRCNYPLLGA